MQSICISPGLFRMTKAETRVVASGVGDETSCVCRGVVLSQTAA